MTTQGLALCSSSGKLQFEHANAARAYARRMFSHWRYTARRCRKRRRVPKYTYRCPTCGWWHLTKVARRTR